MSRIVVLGAGSVGSNLALFLDHMGFSVDLLEAGGDILEGAAQLSFINHGDGFEYYKPGHHITGRYCIEGSLTKALIYPIALLDTGVCSANSPIRFLVAEGALQSGRISRDGFVSNSRYMRSHYAQMYRALATSAYMTNSEAEEVFVRAPGSFMRELSPHDYSDISGVGAGVSGNGFGINMPHYYALVRAALEQSQVACHFGVKIDAITRTRDGDYVVLAGDQAWPASQVLVCTSHHIPELASRIRDVPLVDDFPGTYYLNSMTFLRLPPTQDAERLQRISRINFTLMEAHGCMYACVVPPTGTEDGLAAVYYPDPAGSQHAQHVCRRGDVSTPPPEWDSLLRDGLSTSDPHVVATFNQAIRCHPFLDGYAEVTHAVCRTVFNCSVEGNDYGQDRRVREISSQYHALTSDGRVSAWTAPKWTNAELTALTAVDYALERSGMTTLPKAPHSKSGCGPTKLDVVAISKHLSYRRLKVSSELALRYAQRSRLPDRIVRN